MARQVSTNELKAGLKLEIDGQPWNLVSNEFVKPGKGQPFNRVKLKNLINGRVIEKTYKSGEKLDLADIVESQIRMLYREIDGIVFMDDKSFEQFTVPNDVVADIDQWLMEDINYEVIFYKDIPVSICAPIFMDILIKDTAPGVRGDTASGRVMKLAILESGAKVQIPIFVEQGEKIRIDTRTGDYVSRVHE